MKKIKIIITALLLILPLTLLLYKHYVLDISLIPKKATNLWRVELSLKTDSFARADESLKETFRIPIPSGTESQDITYFKTIPSINKTKDSIIKPSEGTPIKVLADFRLKGQNYYKSIENNLSIKNNLNKNDKSYEKLTKSLSPSQEQHYTKLDNLTTQLKTQLKEVSDSLIFETDSKLKRLEKIFFYLSDELVLQPNNSSLKDVLVLKSGSYLGQARLLTSLARLNGIPARISFGVQILDPDEKSNKYTRVFYSEVFLDGRWIPINPHQKEFGVIKENFIVLHQDSELYADGFNNRNLLSVYAKPITYRTYESSTYVKKLSHDHPFWSKISLHRFPLSIQSIFFAILLIPFGTVILSFLRVVVGVNTFGIFTPILLTLFFLETSLTFGLIFFFLVVFVGLSQRFLLDKFYLLAVPRLSILLTLVILMYLAFAIFMDHYGLMGVGHGSLNYFPIVIITVFIERFSIYYIEEGAKNTLKTALGTFTVSILCYFLLSFTWLKTLLFNNPELLLFALGMNLLLGSYKGYRLLEFFRFSEFRKLEEEV